MANAQHMGTSIFEFFPPWVAGQGLETKMIPPAGILARHVAFGAAPVTRGVSCLVA